MTPARPQPVVGAVLDVDHLGDGERVAAWSCPRRGGRPAAELLAVVIDAAPGRRLVVAEHTPSGWATTHVLAPADDAVRMLARQQQDRA